MRSSIRTIFLTAFLLAAHPSVQAQDTSAADQLEAYELSYDVPESPAFYLLGGTPANVVRGGNAKPLVVSVLNDLLSGGELAPGLAIDFAPYPVFGGSVSSIRELRDNRLLYALSNLALSFGTAENTVDSSSVSYAAGLRITLWDDRDLIYDSRLADSIGNALIANAPAPSNTQDDDEVTQVTLKTPDIEKLYDNARERMRNSRGFALSLGFGYAGALHGGAFTKDSMFAERARLWIAPQYSLGGGTDIIGNIYLGDTNLARGGTPAIGAGFALRGNLQGASVAAEAIWATDTKWTVGVNAGVDVVDGIRLIGTLTTERPVLDPAGPAHLKIRGSFQYNTGN